MPSNRRLQRFFRSVYLGLFLAHFSNSLDAVAGVDQRSLVYRASNLIVNCNDFFLSVCPFVSPSHHGDKFPHVLVLTLLCDTGSLRVRSSRVS